MKRLILLYQLLTGLSDTATGLLLLFAPAFTLSLMRLHVPADSLPFLSYIGAFVLSVGIACLYGASLATQSHPAPQLEIVWLLTGITRALVATFVALSIFNGSLESGWVTVALTDCLFAAIQFIGLAKGWLARA